MAAKDSPQKDVVYVDVDDEITSIIDKVENSAGKVVALVLPKRAATLQSTVNMKLLKRSADTAGKSVVLITSEPALLPLAGAAGLHVAKNLQSVPGIPSAPVGAALAAKAVASRPEEADLVEEEADEEVDPDAVPQKFDYDRPIGALADKYDSENPETIDLDDAEDDEKPAKKSKVAFAAGAAAGAKNKVKVPDFDRFRLMMGLGIAGAIALVVFFILAVFVLPKATVAITTSSEPVTANFNLTASDKAVLDAGKGTLPAKLESMDQTGTQQATATGQQNNGQKATGSVSMTATKCGGNPFVAPDDVPAGTGVSTGGVSYITQSRVSFHGTGASGSCFTYSGNSTDITANAGGSKYNVSGATFTVAGRSDVSATGSASGGTDNMVTVLSQSDVDAAKNKITGGSNGDQFAKDFQNKLTAQGEYVLTSTMKAGDPVVTVTPAVGQPASNATVNVKVTYSVLTVKKDDLKQIIQAKLAGQVDKTKQKLNDNFMNDSTITVQSQPSNTSAVLAVNVNTTAVPIISVATVKKTVAGKKAGHIQGIINNWPGVKTVKVDFSPFWVSKAPSKSSKITVIFKEDKSQNNTNSAP